MAEKIVYFVRHGQSEGNATPVFQSPDSPLSVVGVQQTVHIAERACGLSFETLISSPLERTKQTAMAIAERTGKTIEYSDLFAERVKPTYINDKPYTDKKANALWREWEESVRTSGVRVEDGENFDDLNERAKLAIDFLSKRAEQSLLVVTHGYFLRIIVARVLLRDLLTDTLFRSIQGSLKGMKNTGLTVLKYCDTQEGMRWRLWIYNDHTHLGDYVVQ